nr:hypothetical protein [Rhodoferax sp.]
MNITNMTFKEKCDKVIAALEIAKATLIEYGDWWPVGEPIAIVDCAEALTIMRGLAEDAEPDVWRSQLEGIVDIYLDGTTNPYEHRAYCEGAFDSAMNDVQKMLAATSPQAAQTALKSESLAQAAQAPARLPSEGKTIEALAPIQAAQTDERNGCLSNCRNCQHFRRDTGGHCYMFKDEPQGVCAK